MSTEERDDAQAQQEQSQPQQQQQAQPQPRPKKVIPTVRREGAEQQDGTPYNQGYNRPEGNYERRNYNRPQQGGGYNRPYNNNYGDRQNNRQGYGYQGGGYNRPARGNYGNMNQGGGYGNNRQQYGNNRPYNNNGGDQRSYNRPYNNPANYDVRPGRAYTATPNGEGGSTENTPNVKKRRPRVGDTRVSFNNQNDMRNQPRPNRPYNNNNNNNNNGYGNNAGNARGNNNRRPNQNANANNRRKANHNPNAKYSMQKQLKYKEVLADPNEPIRLNKFLANAGVCSRREADEFIQKGAVMVNGVAITELGTKITRNDKVEFNGKEVHIESKVYIVLNKPKNCVTTSDDPQARLTVMDLVKHACTERIYPVGRLDPNTTGVLPLTNDGDLASKLTHPSFKKKKIYHVWLDKEVSVEDMEKIANGIELEDGEIHADAISYVNEADKTQVGIEIHSGRNRIVRRIFESLGYHVTKLDRVYFAGLTKKNLGRGKWRYLNEKEVNALRMGAFE